MAVHTPYVALSHQLWPKFRWHATSCLHKQGIEFLWLFVFSWESNFKFEKALALFLLYVWLKMIELGLPDGNLIDELMELTAQSLSHLEIQEHFNVIKEIGRGKYGKVLLVTHRFRGMTALILLKEEYNRFPSMCYKNLLFPRRNQLQNLPSLMLGVLKFLNTWQKIVFYLHLAVVLSQKDAIYDDI